MRKKTHTIREKENKWNGHTEYLNFNHKQKNVSFGINFLRANYYYY